jgi:hypothetical protein
LRNHIHFLFSELLFCSFAIIQLALYKFLFHKQLFMHKNELPNPTPLIEDAASPQHNVFVKGMQSFLTCTVISSRKNKLSYISNSVQRLTQLLYSL